MKKWLKRLFSSERSSLIIVRRYTNFNGHHVGELYLAENDKSIHRMIGWSMDSFTLDERLPRKWRLDTKHTFLEPLRPLSVRVGSLDPSEHDNIQATIAALPKWFMRLEIRNGFVYIPDQTRPEYLPSE